MLKFRSICTTLIGGKVYNINGKTIREEKLISEGAYSFVYMAKDLNTNRAYTIKKTICQDKEKINMANKEINILKSLPPHKNIVQYYGSTIISENNYKIVIMLMEYCERGNLLNIFEKNKEKIKEIHIVNILKDIITGLCFLHNQEIPIIHRDIKLENILCDKNGVYKICDFCSHSISNSFFPNDLEKSSLYNLKEEIERDTTLIYRPPELIDLYANLEISCKIDIWMVGCILYLLLFKIHPFQNNNFLSIINASFTIPYCTKYSKRIISILLMTLNKNPQKRIDTTTLLFILENYADLKKWFIYIPADIKKRVNQIFEKMNELNINNKHTDLIEVSNEKLIDIKISSQKYETKVPKNNNNFLKFFTTSNLSGDIFKKKIVKDENTKENKQVNKTEKEPTDKLGNIDDDNNKLKNTHDNNKLKNNHDNDKLKNPHDNDKLLNNHDNDKLQNSHDNDKLLNNHDNDKLQNNNIIDTLQNNNIIDTLENNHIINTLQNNNIIDKLQNNNIIDTLQNNHIIDTLQNNHIINTLQNNNIIDKLQNNNIIDTLQNNHIIDTLQNNHIINTLQNNHIINNAGNKMDSIKNNKSDEISEKIINSSDIQNSLLDQSENKSKSHSYNLITIQSKETLIIDHMDDDSPSDKINTDFSFQDTLCMFEKKCMYNTSNDLKDRKVDKDIKKDDYTVNVQVVKNNIDVHHKDMKEVNECTNLLNLDVFKYEEETNDCIKQNDDNFIKKNNSHFIKQSDTGSIKQNDNDCILLDISLNNDINCFDVIQKHDLKKKEDVININTNNEDDKNAITCSNEYYNFGSFYDPWNNDRKDNNFFGDDNYCVNKSTFIFNNDFFNNKNNDLFDNYELSTINNTEKSNHHLKNNCMDINNNIFSNKNYYEHVDKKEKNISYEYNMKNHPIYSSYKDEKRCNLNDIKQNNSSKYIVSDKNDKFSELLDEFQKCSIK